VQFDSVQIGVRDLDLASASYERVLRVHPLVLQSGARRFQLRHGAVELEGGARGVHSMRFVLARSDAVAVALGVRNIHGLHVHFEAAGAAPASAGSERDGVDGIDHVVVHSSNLERAIATWRDELGIRLALDREFPHRGLRMLFFRNAGVTLEFVSSLSPPADRAAPDQFYGVAYHVSRLETHRDLLVAAGVDVTPVRPGHKPGTVVATVRSATEGVPTLLIGDLGNIKRSGG
jgi:catechol 2,3-dioxygenase-like lactoylglutathione lyase family enzyme